MSRNGSGTYTLPAGNPVVTGTTIASTWANNTLSDIASALTDSVAADGQTAMSGNLNLNSNKIVNLATPTLSTDAVTKAYADALVSGGTGSFTTLTVTGTTTLATSLTGVLKGTSGVVAVATAGTEYVAPSTATTFTALQTFAGTSSNADLKTSNILEVSTVSATAATGTVAYDVTTQSVLYYTSNASGNWTVNFRGSSGTSLNTLMATGESISATFLVTNGSTAYYNSAVQVDGNSVTPKWQGGTAPTAGNTSSIDVYTYVIIKTGSATFTVLASVTKFA